MTPDERDRLSKLEAHQEGLKEDVHSLRADVRELRDDVKALRAMAENAKGGWRTLMLVGGIGTAIGGVIVKFVPVLGRGP